MVGVHVCTIATLAALGAQEQGRLLLLVLLRARERIAHHIGLLQEPEQGGAPPPIISASHVHATTGRMAPAIEGGGSERGAYTSRGAKGGLWPKKS
jgi:hypothetical protein